MTKVRHSISLATVVSIFATLPGTLAARSVVDGWEFGPWSEYTDPMPKEETWAGYYTKQAQISSGVEKRLGNGIRWRLATDQRTRTAMPRIVGMPHNRNLNAATQMLQTVHGGAMLFSDRQQAGYREHLRRLEEEGPQRPGQSEKEHKDGLKVVRNFTPKRIVTQTEVALTYASPSFVSLIDLGFIYTYEGTYTPRIIRGLTLDLERRQIFTMQACPEGSFRRPGAIFNPTFRFAGLLDICDQGSLERFETLVQAAEDQIKAATAGTKDPVIERCRGTSIDEDQDFVVYLAVGGLAVHLTQFWTKAGTLWSNANTDSCTLKSTIRNPLIIPYRTLEPLMKPGPLREELLKSK
jgi:hypothetical protein